MALSTFEKHIVSSVREMPDDQILDLVREKLSSQGAVAMPAKKLSPTVAAPKKVSAKKASRKRSAKTTVDQDERVLAFVLSADGVAVKDVSEGLNLPKSRVSSILRKLRDQKKIAQGGARRFARYAKTKKAAKAASLRARGQG